MATSGVLILVGFLLVVAQILFGKVIEGSIGPFSLTFLPLLAGTLFIATGAIVGFVSGTRWYRFALLLGVGGVACTAFGIVALYGFGIFVVGVVLLSFAAVIGVMAISEGAPDRPAV